MAMELHKGYGKLSHDPALEQQLPFSFALSKSSSWFSVTHISYYLSLDLCIA